MLRIGINIACKSFNRFSIVNRRVSLGNNPIARMRQAVSQLGRNSYNCHIRSFSFNLDSNERRHGWNISSWAAIITGVLAFLWLNKSAQADEEGAQDEETQGLANNKLKRVTKENFQCILCQIEKDNPFVKALELEYPLTEAELKILYSALTNNIELGYIRWHTNQIRYQSLERVEKKLIENNKNYRHYPNDHMHALLSKHAYQTSQKGDEIKLDPAIDGYLKDWRVMRVYDDTQGSGYYGVIYQNDKTHQVVLANRGTEGVIKGLFAKNSDWKTNFEEILGGQIIVGQQAKNLMATADAIELAKKAGYRLSFTGHSLGAWLAELSAYYSHTYFDYRDVKAVTFDSPGTAPMMEKLQSNIRSKDKVKLEDIDIVTYLASPNPANCCNGHVGRVYRVEPSMSWAEKIENRLPQILKDTLRDKIQGLTSVEGHSLTGILGTFDPETGKPHKCQRMLDWPRVEYLGDENFASQGKGIVKDKLKNEGLSTAHQIGLNMALDHIIGDRSIMTIIGFLKTYIQGGIDAEQYWAYFSHIDLEKNIEEQGEQHREFIFDNRFALFTLGKYREGNDTHTMKLVTGSVDKYLYKLYGFKEKLREEGEGLPLIIKVQLEDLLRCFRIVRSGEDFILIPTAGNDVEEIRKRTQRLLEVIPDDIRKVWQNVVVHKTKIFLSGEIEENATRKVKKVSDNLPFTPFIVGISDKEQELKKKLEVENVIVISGLGGMGKSTLAEAEGRASKEKYWQVRWIKSTQIDEEFFQLAKELKIKTSDLSPNEVRDLVYKEYNKAGRDKPILLIFDNVDDSAKIRQYLINQPAGVKVIITSRNANIVPGIPSIQMNGFNKEQAISYVRQALEANKEGADKLVATVGLSPFRLSKAVAYLASRHLMSINEYIQNYEAIKKGQKKDGEIYPEMEMLFIGLKVNAPSSWQLLQYIAYLDAEGVSSEFILKVMRKTKEELERDIDELKNLSLIKIVRDGADGVILKPSHRIVQEETKRALIEEGQNTVKTVLEALVMELNQVFDFSGVGFEGFADSKKTDFTRKEVLEWIPHAKILIKETKAAGLIAVSARLTTNLGFYYQEMLHDYKEAIYYWEELLKDQKLLDTEKSPKLYKAFVLGRLGESLFALNGEENISKSLQCFTEFFDICGEGSSKDHLMGRAYASHRAGLACAAYAGSRNEVDKNGMPLSWQWMQISLKWHQISLGHLRKLYPKGNDPHLEDALVRVGLGYLFLKGEEIYKLGEEEKRMGIKHLEEALCVHQKFYSNEKLRLAELLGFIAWAYEVLGDPNKALEYGKQAYGLSENGFENNSVFENAKKSIQGLQPNFFTRKGKKQNCLGGNTIGNECRYIITTRGKTDENLLKIKQKIQEEVLSHIIHIVDDETRVYKRGWSSISWAGGEWGVKGWMHKDYLREKLKELGYDDRNIELAQMLCFETTALAIMKSEKKWYEVIQGFTRENPQLVKKIAVEHPEFFVDGSIVEACIKAIPGDKVFENHLLTHVKYMGMEQRKNEI